MLYRTLLLILFLGFAPALLIPPGARAQSSTVTEMRVHLGTTHAYAAPRTDARIVATYHRDDRVMVFGRVGPYYKVARRQGDPVGYILGAYLMPFSESEVDRTGQGKHPTARLPSRTRFDIYAGVAAPVQSDAFTDAYRPGANIGARISYRLGPTLALTARFSHGRFEAGGTGRFSLDDVTVDEDDFSVLSGALGFNLTAASAGPFALGFLLDGGVYHVIVNERPADARIVTSRFREDAFTEFGGSIGLQFRLHLGAGIHLFAEPNYEVLFTDPETTQYLSGLIGLSLGR